MTDSNQRLVVQEDTGAGFGICSGTGRSRLANRAVGHYITRISNNSHSEFSRGDMGLANAAA